MAIFDRVSRGLKHAWNAFMNADTQIRGYDGGAAFGARPDRLRLRVANERSIIAAIYCRIAIDIASVNILHVRTDENGRYLEDVKSGLQNCLTLEANMDQAARHFRQDIVLSLFDRGNIAIVPIDTTIDPSVSGSYDIQTLRVGEITGWMPDRVTVNCYDERKGYRRDITVEKKYTAIVENPLFTVMNEPNSTLQRLIRKLNILDAIDEQTGSGKLDIIIQLPYTVRSDLKKAAAEQRRNTLEAQMKGSQYGIAYIDATEKITQLNRPAENNLLKQVEYLTEMLYSQLGLTTDIMNGTADEKTMLNYINRTVEPVVAAIVEAMRRTFLTKTARSQGQTIMYFRDPFKLVPISELADIADKFTRSEVASSNDLRQIVGWKPSKDPKADELRNTNMPEPTPVPSEPTTPKQKKLGGDSQNGT